MRARGKREMKTRLKESTRARVEGGNDSNRSEGSKMISKLVR